MLKKLQHNRKNISPIFPTHQSTTTYVITYDAKDLGEDFVEEGLNIYSPSNEFDINQYLVEVVQIEHDVSRMKGDSEALKASDITQIHLKRANKLEDSFMSGIAGDFTGQEKQR